MNGFADIHTHLLPDVDDGAQGTSDAMKLVQMAYENGTRTMILTPHYRGKYKENDPGWLTEVYDMFCTMVAEKYPEIELNEWFIDIMTAKLIDEKRRRDFQVLLLPNLYGDIISDEAAEFQGGVGTAGCANIGKKYAMFEAIHGSAPRMVNEGRAQYADPCSMLRACVMLLSHIGYQDRADKLERALDVCSFEEKRLVITGRADGATCADFGKYVMETLKSL